MKVVLRKPGCAVNRRHVGVVEDMTGHAFVTIGREGGLAVLNLDDLESSNALSPSPQMAGRVALQERSTAQPASREALCATLEQASARV
jgi:hypothetical protein